MEVIAFFEHKVRELPALRRLRSELQKRGDTVSIYSIAFEWSDAYASAKKHGIDVLLVPWCYRADQFWRFSPFYELNPELKMINLHHEQITPQLTKNVLLPRDQIACEYPWHFSWTEYFRDLLISAGVDESRIRVVGNLRLEPTASDRERLSTRASFAERYHLDTSKKWIIYAESRRIDAISLEKIGNDLTVLSDVSVADCERYFERWKLSLRRTIDQIKSLPRSFFDEFEIIYRPHPGSTIDFSLGEYARIISDGPIAPWINSSDVFCTWQSTSAFEADMAGLPVFFHESVPIPESERMPGVSDYYSIHNIDEINSASIEKCLLSREQDPIFTRYVGRWDPDADHHYADAVHGVAALAESKSIVPYNRVWKMKMWGSELVIRFLKRYSLIRKLHWPKTASMMYDDIPFGDKSCIDLHR